MLLLSVHLACLYGAPTVCQALPQALGQSIVNRKDKGRLQLTWCETTYGKDVDADVRAVVLGCVQKACLGQSP